MDIIGMLKNIFEQKGIFISEDDYDMELMLDSLQFVSIIVEIEETFLIEIDDSYFYQNKLSTFNDFFNIVNNLIV